MKGIRGVETVTTEAVMQRVIDVLVKNKYIYHTPTEEGGFLFSKADVKNINVIIKDLDDCVEFTIRGSVDKFEDMLTGECVELKERHYIYPFVEDDTEENYIHVDVDAGDTVIRILESFYNKLYYLQLLRDGKQLCVYHKPEVDDFITVVPIKDEELPFD